jgi:hypothetical protein
LNPVRHVLRVDFEEPVGYQASALADVEILTRLLAGAGLKAVRVLEETRVHRFESFEEYWHPFETGADAMGSCT